MVTLLLAVALRTGRTPARGGEGVQAPEVVTTAAAEVADAHVGVVSTGGLTPSSAMPLTDHRPG